MVSTDGIEWQKDIGLLQYVAFMQEKYLAGLHVVFNKAIDNQLLYLGFYRCLDIKESSLFFNNFMGILSHHHRLFKVGCLNIAGEGVIGSLSASV